MEQERYEIQEGQYHLIDPELGLSYVEPFPLSYLPTPFSEKTFTKWQGKEELIQEKEEGNNLSKVYFKSEGKIHGQYVAFYPKGARQSESFYHRGQLHGSSTFYSEEGNILSRSWFYQGQQVGKAKQYYANGALSSVQRFKAGKLEGLQEYFYENGTLKTLLDYHEGELHGDVRLFWESGIPKRRCHFIHGKREGWDKIWNEAAIVLDEGCYKNAEPIGVHRRRYASGQLREEIQYHTPLCYDRREWDEEGKCIYEAVYDDRFHIAEKKWKESEGLVIVREGEWDGAKLRWK